MTETDEQPLPWLTRSASSIAAALYQRRWTFIFGGLLLLTLGIRLALNDRFTDAFGYEDDWAYHNWREGIAHGHPDWMLPFRRYNEHLYAFYPLVSMFLYWANGIWEIRDEVLAYTLVSLVYTCVILRGFDRATEGRARPILALVTAAFVMIPFAGYQANWGNVIGFAFTMLVSVLAIYLAAWHAEKIWAAVLIAVCFLVAAFSMGSGLLASLATITMLVLRGALRRRLARTEIALVLFGGAVFLWTYLGIPRGIDVAKPEQTGIFHIAIVILQFLAWPAGWIPLLGLVNMLPPAILAFRYVRDPAKRSPSNEFLITITGFMLLQAIGVAVMRHGAENNGAPASRYTDIVTIIPFLAVAALANLFVALPKSVWLRVLGMVLYGGFAFGFSLQFFYRLWPHDSREFGELPDANRINWLRDQFINGWHTTASTDMFPKLKQWFDQAEDDPVVHRDVLIGHLLKPTPDSSGFSLDGINGAYVGLPTLRYWGSSGETMSRLGRFTSEPFLVRAPWLAFDLILPQRSRFSLYRLPGLDLEVIDDETGERQSLLGKLLHTYPSILRNREAVLARVQPGHQYHIEATDNSKDSWFAFSEPTECGRLAPIQYAAYGSSKLFALLGFMLLSAGGSTMLFRPGFPSLTSAESNI